MVIPYYAEMVTPSYSKNLYNLSYSRNSLSVENANAFTHSQRSTTTTTFFYFSSLSRNLQCVDAPCLHFKGGVEAKILLSATHTRKGPLKRNLIGLNAKEGIISFANPLHILLRPLMPKRGFEGIQTDDLTLLNQAFLPKLHFNRVDGFL